MSKAIGDIAEAYVIYRLFTYGHNAQLFFCDNVPYDAVVEIDGRLYKVQIKGTANPDPSRVNSCRFSTSKGCYADTYYTKEDFDILALVYTGVERCLFIPNTSGFSKCKRISTSKFNEAEERGSWHEAIKTLNA